MASQHYDLIVIGSGPAGEKGAAQAAYFGKRVALVEMAESLGGAAANTGTLPSKTLREAALHLSGMKQRGFRIPRPDDHETITVDDFLFRKRIVRDSERARIMVNLENHEVTRLRGIASFSDDHTVLVQDGKDRAQHTADVILIATGSRPYHPDIFPFSDALVYDSDSILNMQQLPKSLTIIGGGVIGVEYAGVFASLGIDVNVIHNKPTILNFMDREIAELLEMSLRAMGVNLVLDQRVERFIKKDPVIQLQLDNNQMIDSEAVLVTTGRPSNVE